MRESNEFNAQREGHPRVLSSHDGLGIVEVGSACLVLWRSPVVSARFARQRAALDAHVARYPARAGFVCVIELGVPVPEEKFRRASIDLVSGLSDKLSCVVCVIEGSGFRAAATRSVLSGMALLLPKRRADVRFSATVEAAGLVVERFCDGVSSAGLSRAHQLLSRSLTANVL